MPGPSPGKGHLGSLQTTLYLNERGAGPRRTCRSRRPGSGAVGFEELQAPVKVSGLDRPDKGVDHRRYRGRFARRDHAVGGCRGNRLHRSGDVSSALDRRQDKLHHAFAAWRQDAFDAEPQRCRVADECRLDGLRVTASDSPANNAAAAMIVLLRPPIRRPAGLPDRRFSNRRPRTRPGGFGANPLVIGISLVHREGRFRNRPSARSMQCQLGNCLIVAVATIRSLFG